MLLTLTGCETLLDLARDTGGAPIADPARASRAQSATNTGKPERRASAPSSGRRSRDGQPTSPERAPTPKATTDGATAALPGLQRVPEGERGAILEVYGRVRAGGPHPFSRDGVPFQNREGRLPKQRSGYYREWTVPTPGSRDRGARRLVTGERVEVYYTSDHYRSFVRLDGGGP